MHLSEEMVGQPSVVVQSAQVGAADVADLQFLVTRRTRGILEVLEITLISFFLMLCCSDFVHFIQGHCDRTSFAEDGDLEEASVDSIAEIGDLFELGDN